MTDRPTIASAETIQGDPSQTASRSADREYEKLISSDFGQPFLIAVKLRGEEDTLHLRVLVDDPNDQIGWANLEDSPEEIQELAAATSPRSALSWRLFAKGDRSRELYFDAAKKVDAWALSAATSSLGDRTPHKSALDEFPEAEQSSPAPPFDPANQEDARKRILAEVVRRQGQRTFRRQLMKVYKGECPVTGCRIPWVLEAAHISPYRGPETNKSDNGLILRADVHTLFDLGLLSIDPDTLLIRVAARITDPDYRALHGQKLRVGTVTPSKMALREHWDRSTD